MVEEVTSVGIESVALWRVTGGGWWEEGKDLWRGSEGNWERKGVGGGRGLSEQGTATGPGAPTGTFPGFAATLILFTQVLKNCCSSDRGGHGVLCLRLDRCLIIMNPDT